MKRYLFLLFLFFFLCGNKSLLFADIKEGIELGIYGGNITCSNGTLITVDYYRKIKTEIEENGYTGGIRVAYNFNSNFAMELSFAPVSSNDYIVMLTDAGSSWGNSEEITTYESFLYGNAILHILKGHLVPYFTAGAGWILFVDDASFSFNYGGGLKLLITDKVALRLDSRIFNTRLNSTIGQVRWNSGQLEERQGPYTDDLLFKEITIGISYFF